MVRACAHKPSTVGADIVRELGLLCVERSPSAARKIYRSLRSTPRYDTEHEKGWADHISNIGPMKLTHPPSELSPTGRIETFAGEVLDDIDVSAPDLDCGGGLMSDPR
jgi:hypothetical protein